LKRENEKTKMFIWHWHVTNNGRYLAILFIYKLTREALILSARDMAKKEKKLYEKT
jgi:uncharacterized DUF497 family protein